MRGSVAPQSMAEAVGSIKRRRARSEEREAKSEKREERREAHTSML